MNKRVAARTEQELAWRDRLSRFASCGQSIKDFCSHEAVSVWSFYYWRKTLDAASQVACSPTVSAAQPFIDLGSMPASRDLAAGGNKHSGEVAAIITDVRLDLGGGLVLQITRR